MKKRRKISRPPLAEQLYEYVKQRAAVEGVGFKLTLEYFRGFVLLGANPVFGVEYDEKGMIHDYQEPYPGFFIATREEILGGWKEATATRN